MSRKLVNRVYESVLGRAERDVMLVLADFADDDGYQVYPSIAYIAWKIDYSERQVQRAMGKLKEMGALQVLRDGQGGRGRRPVYRIRVDALQEKPPFRRGPASGRCEGASQKGDKMSPFFAAEKGDMGDTLSTQKGDTGVILFDPERVTSATQKGDISGSAIRKRRELDPSGMITHPPCQPESQEVDSAAAAPPDDAIDRVLQEYAKATGAMPRRDDRKQAAELLGRASAAVVVAGIWGSAVRATAPIRTLKYCRGCIEEFRQAGLGQRALAAATASARRMVREKRGGEPP